ncbi:MAG: leucine-rich repeat domain-containing protein [Bacteroidia bacterium]|nr:leucine-rich repeat domain-containing protein [Bacteroidia bacterium]
MKRTSTIFILLVSVFLFKAASLNAQKLLAPKELEKEKWYYSMEEALSEPDKVYKLSLNGQKLKKLPPEIAQLKNLQLLNLGENKFKTLPPEIGQLKNLQFLSLYHNKLKFVPAELKNLGNLEVLFLARNKISILPVWVGGLGHLHRLDVTYNRITPKELSILKLKMPKCTITP